MGHDNRSQVHVKHTLATEFKSAIPAGRDIEAVLGRGAQP